MGVWLVAVVRKTLPSAMMGDDQPRPGTSVFHSTFWVVDQWRGRWSLVEVGTAAGPRKPGQGGSVAAVVGAAIRRVAIRRVVIGRGAMGRGEGVLVVLWGMVELLVYWFVGGF
jgi:hypothetical protein